MPTTRYSNTESAFSTITLAINKLEEVCPLAARLISIVCFFDAQNISTDFLSGALSRDPGIEQSSGLEDLDLLDAIEGLESSALAIRQDQQPRL